jgi:hypothetical protein
MDDDEAFAPDHAQRDPPDLAMVGPVVDPRQHRPLEIRAA